MRAGAALLLGVLIAGCGGDANVRVVSGGGQPTPLPGTSVSGQVKLPKGQVASAPASVLMRVARAMYPSAEALSGSVLPVGAGVDVQLFQIEPSDIVNGEIASGKLLGDNPTTGSGYYQIEVPENIAEDTCHLLVRVGTGSSLTRAFVFSFGKTVDIDFYSETVVRLILAKVATGVPFCNFSNDDIQSILSAVKAAPGTAVGDTAGAINQSAFQLASVDPVVQSVLNAAGATPTNTPTRFFTPSRTPTPTDTPIPSTATGTPSASATPTVTPTTSDTPTATETPTPTATATETGTPTETSVPTPTSTRTQSPSPTPTSLAVPTDTPVPTATASHSPVPPTPTNTIVPTATQTTTVTSSPTSAVPAGNIDVGSASGAPGATVSIAVMLANGGGKIVATSNDLVYDSTQVNVAIKPNSKPDCTIDSSIGSDSAVGKTLVVSQPPSPADAKILRVGIIGTDNANPIPDGPLFACNFVISGTATLGIKTLTNVPSASDANAQALNVIGTNGSITVAASATPTTTSAPTPTSTPVPSLPQLSAPIGANDTTIPVDDVSGLPSSGTLLIGQELIHYNGIQLTGGGAGGIASGQPGVLLNVERGVNGTTPQAHDGGDVIAVVPSGTTINVGSDSGLPGDTVVIGVTLISGSNQLAATSNDIAYDSSVVNVKLKTNNKPDCTINSAIDADSAIGKSLVVSQPPSPANAKILRVGILGTDNANIIPDGPLFTCNFVIAGGAAPGLYPLKNTPSASDANAVSVTVSGTDGSIQVLSLASPTQTATVAVATATNTTGAVQATPTNTSGGVVATSTATVPATPTNTTSAASTLTPTPSGPAINLGSAIGAPGDTVAISATLAGTGGNKVSATSNDIVFDSSLVSAKLKPNSKPDCTISGAIDVNSDVGKTLAASLPPSPANAKILRVGIIGTDNANFIPDGLLFTCNFVIADGASGAIPLTNVPSASDADAVAVVIGGANGSIVVAPHTATPTNTSIVAATDTPAPTATSTTVPPAATPSNTTVPATATPTNTTAAVATATPTPSGPVINLGSTSGMAGATVTISATLAGTGGTTITATSNDIVFDSSLVSIKLKPNSKPDCTIDSSIDVNSDVSKTLAASLPPSPANAKILRVGIIGTDNANFIPDGPLFSCNFVIAAGASGTITLTNVPSASDANAVAVTVGGSNGSISVQ
ncbi:MAG TPA: cohesin domain-containing protein [Candidatus Binatia bacterium]|nr:cohesin domain-containing protein [Candidatus Binatia bacterium]